MKIEAVLFDVGNTLLRVPNDAHERAISTASHLGDIPFKTYKASLQRARREWWEKGGAEEFQDLPETWVGHIRRALELIEFQGDASIAAQLIEDSFLLDGWELYSEVIEVLEEIDARGFRMGIVSNWPPNLEETLEAAGIRKFFEVVVVSGKEGYAKPHPQIFKAAVQRLGVDPQATLYVGDSPELDVQGAAAVGMPAILLDRDQQWSSHPESMTSLHGLLSSSPLIGR